MSGESVRYELSERVAVVRLDDDKANALSPGVIGALGRALDRAEKEAGALLLVGRPGRFSAGFDLAVMRSGAEPMRDLVASGGELFLRFFEFPLPIVSACTGHALAAGAIALLASDARIGAGGEFKIGLNEVAIGMGLPIFAMEMARQRLSKRHFVRATSQAEIYGPDAAVDAGFLDRAVEAEGLFDAALAEAARLAELPQPAFGHTKRRIHAAMVDRIRETLDEDMRRLSGGPKGAG